MKKNNTFVNDMRDNHILMTYLQFLDWCHMKNQDTLREAYVVDNLENIH